jgi:hypothetical protein
MIGRAAALILAAGAEYSEQLLLLSATLGTVRRTVDAQASGVAG